MIVLLYQLFGILSGAIEAVLYSRRGAEAFTRNEHAEMMLQRIVVALLPIAGAVVALVTGTWVHVAFELVPAALLFPMCHDEAYNFTRLWIDCRERVSVLPGYPKIKRPWVLKGMDWQDYGAWLLAWAEYEYGYQSPTTTARNDFNGPQRTGLAAAGLIIWVIGYLIIL